MDKGSGKICFVKMAVAPTFGGGFGNIIDVEALSRAESKRQHRASNQGQDIEWDTSNFCPSLFVQASKIQLCLFVTLRPFLFLFFRLLPSLLLAWPVSSTWLWNDKQLDSVRNQDPFMKQPWYRRYRLDIDVRHGNCADRVSQPGVEAELFLELVAAV